VSLDLMVRSLLTLGATREDVGKVIGRARESGQDAGARAKAVVGQLTPRHRPGARRRAQVAALLSSWPL
jgi:hypothetical protein